jgi:hypothetical protein
VKPRRTHYSTNVFRLVGGNEDNDLWVQRDIDGTGHPIIRSCWVPTEEERAAIAAGANVELITWGIGTPPLAMSVVSYPLGKPPEAV